MNLIDRIIELATAIGTDVKTINSSLLSVVPDAVDASFTAGVNTSVYLPPATLTANRTITIPAGTNGDIIEFYNNEAGFVWQLGGGGVYLSDNITVITFLYANTNYIIKKISGKWRVVN
ncbi:hypothetical protein [Flavobacterium sp. IMCC34518]|uniref:hypothetical protein n=1 Tax=Flavobacterium sp. IMCC34518 TaxID=3003623 RepID=UPI0022ABCE5D|nr:hypothetical protein [Flavobacterium sp. IMCC34518]